MSWIVPAQLVTLTGSLILIFTYLNLYLQERQRYLAVWLASWSVYTARSVFEILTVLWGPHPVLVATNLMSMVWSAALLFWGTRLFSGKELNRGWLALFAGGSLLIIAGVPFPSVSPWAMILTYSLAAFASIATGITLLRLRQGKEPSRSITGWAFVLWGLHKADHPLLRPIVWVAPYGYLLGAVLGFVSAIGMVLVFLEKTKKELKANEAKYRGVFAAESDALFLVDAEDGSILEVNDATCSLYGYERDEILTLKMWDVSAEPEEKVSRVKEPLHRIPLRYHKKKDGTVFPVEISLSTLSLGGRQIMIGAVRDISDRMRVEDELRALTESLEDMVRKRTADLERSKIRYQDMMDLLPGMAFETDTRGVLTYVNSQVVETFGYDRDEIVGSATCDILVADIDRPRFVSELSGTASDMSIRIGEYAGIRKDGLEFPILVRISGMKQKLGGIRGVIMDLTEIRRVERALVASEEKYRSLFEGSRDALFIAGPDGSIREVNNSFRVLLGYPKDTDFAGVRIQSFCPDVRQRKRLQQEIAKAEGVTDYALKLRRNDGSGVECFISVNRKDSNGTAGYEGSIRDISERQMLQREVMSISAAEQARIGQDLHDSLGQLLTGIALKSKSLANFLERNSFPGTGDATRIADLANQAVVQARNLARNLLSADIDHGGICAWLEDFSLRVGLLYDVSCTFAYVPENIEMDRVVAQEFYRIAHEAFMNAIKHGKASSVSISLHRMDHVTTLRVTDNGVGFSNAERTNGIGLRLMNYRAHSIGASLDIHDSGQGGTVVECVLVDD
ncbi:MAG: PAS domain S-box protein [Syntrophorhabdales bacterium]